MKTRFELMEEDDIDNLFRDDGTTIKNLKNDEQIIITIILIIIIIIIIIVIMIITITMIMIMAAVSSASPRPFWQSMLIK